MIRTRIHGAVLDFFHCDMESSHLVVHRSDIKAKMAIYRSIDLDSSLVRPLCQRKTWKQNHAIIDQVCYFIFKNVYHTVYQLFRVRDVVIRGSMKVISRTSTVCPLWLMKQKKSKGLPPNNSFCVL